MKNPKNYVFFPGEKFVGNIFIYTESFDVFTYVTKLKQAQV